ncbi:hypothetical protein CDD82_2560 [Ophiocordyceps australis]|uniref:Vps41 beta-propeller domain-containing protein n=1 Tax=Ophiocordyceps australis TaxID=1399860 RepID=A0A2C5ZBB7_9HYPO|nr:hypothetical protein CDD82_2560 [Ophiocordyceps australis]
MTEQPETSRDAEAHGKLSNSPSESHSDGEEAHVSAPMAGNGTAGTAKQDKRADSDEEEDGDDEGEQDEQDDDDDDDDDDEDEDDEEPRLKYARLTQHLGPVYRSGDATSAFLLGGDKMIIGTHNGNIHVVQLPSFQPLRVYHAHSASVTALSVSPYPSPLSSERLEASPRISSLQARPSSRQSDATSPAAASRKPKEKPLLAKTISNDIYIATSSMDGNVCVQSLIDPKDVQLRNFARPIQAVALSPEYKTDRTYLSGGLAGQLVLTQGGGPGRSTSTTTGTAVAAASGWLGSMGLGHNSGKDSILHSGEGTINCIKWSLSGKYVVWLNEYGIKMMRSKLHLGNTDSDHAWKRMAHIDRPQTEEWESMASVWKGRAEWIDEKTADSDDTMLDARGRSASPALDRLRHQTGPANKSVERLLVGWGGTIWIIHVHSTGGSARGTGETGVGRAEIAKILRMDCIISGISLYTKSLLLVLAFCPPDDESQGKETGSNHEAKGKKKSRSKNEATKTSPRRLNNQPPELRLIDLNSQAEIEKDGLSVSRFERLSSADYHLAILPSHTVASTAESRGALETLAGFGTDMWNVAINPKSLFNSGASIRSKDSGEDVASGSKAPSSTGTMRGGRAAPTTLPPNMAKPGAKIFIHSPYDCILGTKRDLSDHLAWLVEHQEYQRAWELLDDNPDIVATFTDKAGDAAVSTPLKHQTGVDDFFDDESTADASQRSLYSSTEKEKRRIGELWIQDLVEQDRWASAGQVCAKVLAAPDRWEKWVWTFAGAKRFDEITDQIPCKPLHPPLPSTIYEVVLGHYLQTDKPRFRELLDRWPTHLFNANTVVTALENQLKFRDVREDSIDQGVKGRDWRVVIEGLARLQEACGKKREALRCYIKLHDADSAFRLIKESHLAEAVADDIASFIRLRVDTDRQKLMSMDELAEATGEAITLLVDEAQHGLVRPEVVVNQLNKAKLDKYLYFYLKGLWRGQGIKEHMGENIDRLVQDSRSLVDDFADMAVHLFAKYDRPVLMEFLKSSTCYMFEKAVQECEDYEYDDELVYLYSKTGQMKRALYLIIDRLKNVHKAIEFAKEQDDPDLWEDLLSYSMDKPSFIRALLEQIGTSINPIALVRRIPEGLEIQGLREGLTHMMKEHELQHSISSGAARILRSELAAAQNELRAGQRRGIKFDVWPLQPSKGAHGGSGIHDDGGATDEMPKQDKLAAEPGRCAGCGKAFDEEEMERLLGFACGHVYHVGHLLDMLHESKQASVELPENEGQGSRYLVGMKVMRARLLRDKVGGGCPVCHNRAA